MSLSWKHIKILYVSTAIISGFQLHKAHFPAPWIFSIITLIAMPLMMLVVVAMNASRMPRFWNLPQWDTNPFLLRSEPFHFFHVIAWQAIASGVVGYLLIPWTGISAAGQATVSIAFGISLLLGIYLSVNVFRKRFRDKSISAKAVFFGSWQKPKSVK